MKRADLIIYLHKIEVSENRSRDLFTRKFSIQNRKLKKSESSEKYLTHRYHTRQRKTLDQI